MTDGQFNHAKFIREQIHSYKLLWEKHEKAFFKIQNDELDKVEILEMYEDIRDALCALIEIKEQEFKEI